MSLIKVMYDPKISKDGQKEIQETITASMVSQDGSTSQFCLSAILDNLESLILSEEDIKELKRLDADGIDYIEI